MVDIALGYRRARLLVVSSALTFAAWAPAQGDLRQLTSDLRSKEIHVRLAAIDALGGMPDTTAARTLQPLLRNKDWEVQEHAAAALGRLRSQAALGKLVDLAVDGNIVRVRQAAAKAAGAIDASAAAKALFKQAKGDAQVAAIESLALVLRSGAAFEDADELKALVKSGEAALREAAAVAWLEAAADRGAAIAELMDVPHLVVRCRVLEAIAAAPRQSDLTAMVKLFGGAGQNEVVARRIVRALAAAIRAFAGDAPKAVQALDSAGSSDITLRRRAAIVPLLAGGDAPVFDEKQAVTALEPCLVAQQDDTRALAARALREIGGAAALDRALRQFDADRGARPRYQLVETVAALRESKTAGAVKWLVDVFSDARNDESVRERAVVAVGRSGALGATASLVAMLDASEWNLAVCAAVSLGKTDADDALAPLQKLLGHRDWKLRGAAVVGLMHWSREAAVDPLIEALGDEHPLVAQAAHHALCTMSRNYDAKPTAKAWRAWWQEHRASHDFVDREAALDKLKKYGYAVPDSEIYQGLDVIVYQARREGDHIEQLLDRLEIAYRTTKADEVTACGLHPEAIFVSNCTGELGADDVEPLAWFVRTGGSLFGSCWALTETIGRVHPGVMQQHPTGHQVLDDVRARPCRPESQLLTGVFGEAVVPIYHLEGAHLIQVLDAARCEVLIDSPDAAERHGCGNLAAWFRSGHGVCFDSVNHFDLQGLGVAGVGKLKKPEQRQAYAVDHLGMSLSTWREESKAGYWRSNSKANEAVPDLSAFRLLTNFVRSKRIGN